MIRNILQPTGDQARAFRDHQTGEPIYMLNLLKFREHADYEDGRNVSRTGREAYELCGEGFRRVMKPSGCSVVYPGAVRGILIGEGADDFVRDTIEGFVWLLFCYSNRRFAMIAMPFFPASIRLRREWFTCIAGLKNGATPEPGQPSSWPCPCPAWPSPPGRPSA